MNHLSTLDLTGIKYGRLTVLYRTVRVRYGRYKWLCKCDCGKELEVVSDSLRSGNTRSCGCYKKEETIKSRAKDLTGQVFDRLCVKQLSNRKGNNGQRYWWCQCACGVVKEIAQESLKKIKSCGCYNKEQSSKRFRTHGLSRTNAYWEMHNRIRREQTLALDSEWTLEMESLLRALQPVCVICGGRNYLATDHVLPLSKGHGLKPGNVVRLCKSCNSKKGNRNLDELPDGWKERIIYAADSFRITYSDLKEG